MIDLQRTRFPRPRTDAIDPKPSLRSPRCEWLRRVDSGPSGLISQRRGSADDGHSGHAGTAGSRRQNRAGGAFIGIMRKRS